MQAAHVFGKRLGIVGMGRIGRAIARRCHYGFGMEVRFHYRSPVAQPGFPAAQVATLAEARPPAKRGDMMAVSHRSGFASAP